MSHKGHQIGCHNFTHRNDHYLLMATVDNVCYAHPIRSEPTRALVEATFHQPLRAHQPGDRPLIRRSGDGSHQALMVVGTHASPLRRGCHPPGPLRQEQEQIATSLLRISDKLNADSLRFDKVARNLEAARDLSENCALARKTAPDHIKKQFNQVFFQRILVNPDTGLVPEMAQPFDTLCGPELRELLVAESTALPDREIESA